MKIVLDTNVMVSGLLNPFGTPGEIVRLIATGDLSLCYDARVLIEYKDVLLRPKFCFNKAHVNDFLEEAIDAGTSVIARPLVYQLPDPDDAVFLEIAHTAKAACLITGNVKHFPAGKRQGVKVFSPKDFIAFYRKETRSTNESKGK